MHAYAASVREELGRVNVIVNNAGVALHGDFEEVSYDDFEWVMDVDFWGVVQGTKEFLPHLIESGDGHVVNISSLFGLIAMPGQTAYNSAKFAVRGFTEALRQEMLIAKHPVQVTCVHPGGIKTAHRPQRAGHRVARPGRTSPSTSTPSWRRMTPERAAEIILDGVLANKPRVLVGADAKVLDLVRRGPRRALPAGVHRRGALAGPKAATARPARRAVTARNTAAARRVPERFGRRSAGPRPVSHQPERHAELVPRLHDRPTPRRTRCQVVGGPVATSRPARARSPRRPGPAVNDR